MAQPTVKTIRWESVDGKELLYLKIEGGGETYTVNVGQKTYDAVLAMEKQIELPLETTETEKALLKIANESRVDFGKKREPLKNGNQG